MKAVRELAEQLRKAKASEAALTATVKDLRAKLAQVAVGHEAFEGHIGV